MILFIHDLDNVEGRNHYHKKQNKKSPAPKSPAHSPAPPSDTSPPSSTSPSVPSDPYPNDPGDSGCVFDVMSFGAVGDGSADDTAAFREAWKAACAVESGVVLAPENYCFMITSTIFSGPCKPGLVFQVRMLLQFPTSSKHDKFSFLDYYMVYLHGSNLCRWKVLSWHQMDQILGLKQIAEVNGLCFIDLINSLSTGQESLKAMGNNGGIFLANLTG